MRKITEEAYKAFKNNKNYNGGNTKVIIGNSYVFLELFGNKIARKDQNGNVEITLAGYTTRTTLDRLNAFIPLKMSKGVVYVVKRSRDTGIVELLPWNGDWAYIDDLKNGRH